MPRQIIDTESSRPRYVRRLVVTWVIAALVVAVLIFVAFAVYGRFGEARHPAAVPAASPHPALSSSRPPGK